MLNAIYLLKIRFTLGFIGRCFLSLSLSFLLRCIILTLVICFCYFSALQLESYQKLNKIKITRKQEATVCLNTHGIKPITHKLCSVKIYMKSECIIILLVQVTITNTLKTILGEISAFLKLVCCGCQMDLYPNLK